MVVAGRKRKAGGAAEVPEAPSSSAPSAAGAGGRGVPAMAIAGRRESGKSWKLGRTPSKLMNKSPGARTSFEAKMVKKEADRQFRERRQALRDLAREVRDGKRKATEDKRARKAENEQKNLVYQEIADQKRVKRMSKKQLRNIVDLKVAPKRLGKGMTA